MASRKLRSDNGIKIMMPKPSKTQMRELSFELRKMVNQFSKRFKTQVFGELLVSTTEKFADAQIGNFAAIFLALAKKVKRKLLRQYSDDRIENMIRVTTDKLDKTNREALYSGIEDKMGISGKELYNDEGLKSTMNAFRLETTEWAKRLRDETLEDFTAKSLRVMAEGGTLKEVLSNFNDVTDERERNADMVARTQVATFNSLMTKARAQNLGITEAIWETAEDERVRPSHAQRNQKSFLLSEGLYSSIDGKTLLPGIDYNCRCTYFLKIPED